MPNIFDRLAGEFTPGHVTVDRAKHFARHLSGTSLESAHDRDFLSREGEAALKVQIQALARKPVEGLTDNDIATRIAIEMIAVAHGPVVRKGDEYYKALDRHGIERDSDRAALIDADVLRYLVRYLGPAQDDVLVGSIVSEWETRRKARGNVSIVGIVNSYDLALEQKARILKTIEEHYELNLSEVERQIGKSVGWDVAEKFARWAAIPFRLGKPDGSAAHKLREALFGEKVLTPTKNVFRVAGSPNSSWEHAFVIEHDWARAFEKARDFDGGEWKLPYEKGCAFEFVVNGKRMIVPMGVADFEVYDTTPPRCPSELGGVMFLQLEDQLWCAICPFLVRDGKGIVAPGFYEETNDIIQELIDLIVGQVRAVSIALEAEAAETEVIRAPHKLNAAREKRGKLPLLDYHVVTLGRRKRYPPVIYDSRVEGNERRSPRLHFRRGHWRHFPDHKTWIAWMLVGDPDLGFVDKHYRL